MERRTVMSLINVRRCDWPLCKVVDLHGADNVAPYTLQIATVPIAQLDLCCTHREEIRSLEMKLSPLKDGLIERFIKSGGGER
mgnify:CR=1 FL=1